MIIPKSVHLIINVKPNLYYSYTFNSSEVTQWFWVSFRPPFFRSSYCPSVHQPVRKPRLSSSKISNIKRWYISFKDRRINHLLKIPLIDDPLCFDSPFVKLCRRNMTLSGILLDQFIQQILYMPCDLWMLSSLFYVLNIQ